MRNQRVKHKTGPRLIVAAATLAFGSLLCVTFAATPPPTPPAVTHPVNFARDVQPILKTSCYQCHGPESQQAGLRFDRKEAVMKGGVSGPLLMPGHGADSLLLSRVLGQDNKPRMPLGFAPLSDTQIATLKAWVDQGALWNGGATPKHWAYLSAGVSAASGGEKRGLG